MRECKKCEKVIPQERLEILPETTLCVECSKTLNKKRVGFMVFGGGGNHGKTGGSIVMIDVNDKEALRRAERANRRAR